LFKGLLFIFIELLPLFFGELVIGLEVCLKGETLLLAILLILED
jgi:hypothetical protein